MSATKEELLARITACRDDLNSLIKVYLAHPNPEIRDIISEIIEAIARLEGRPLHDV